MDQNQTTTVDNDLQKAIDDITNTTNVDPVFSDPVAAPSSVPEGDTGELGEPVGPFPEPKLEVPTPATDPNTLMPPTDGLSAPIEPAIPAPDPAAMPEMPDMQDLKIPDLTPPPAPTATPTPPLTDEEPQLTSTTPSAQNLNMHQIKEAALRDLVPLLGKVNMEPSQKFNIYRDIFENLGDYTVLESAYNAAKEIPDESERAEALLYLVESIDKM